MSNDKTLAWLRKDSSLQEKDDIIELKKNNPYKEVNENCECDCECDCQGDRDEAAEFIEKIVDGIKGVNAFYLGSLVKHLINAVKKQPGTDSWKEINKAAECAQKMLVPESFKYPYVFPDASNVFGPHGRKKQMDKILEEALEARDALNTYLTACQDWELDDFVVEEVLDTIHACETYLRTLDDDAWVCEMAMKVINKNLNRGYYATKDEEQDINGKDAKEQG